MGHYLALDPGQTTGWALFDTTGKPIQMGEVQYEELAALLEEYHPIDFFVVEEFMVRTKYSHAGRKHHVAEFDKAIAARAIGKIEARAELIRVPVHFQQSNILEGAGMMFGYKKKGHKKDVISAVLHGLHYAHINFGLLPNRVVSIEESVVAVPTTVVPLSGSFKQALKAAKRK